MPNTIGADTLILITRDGMGQAPAELQRKLVVTYLRLLLDNGTLPGAVALYTEGVHLAAEGSPALEVLAELEAKGVRVILCKTCVDWFGLDGRTRVGVIGGMGDIVSAQAMAGKVITI